MENITPLLPTLLLLIDKKALVVVKLIKDKDQNNKDSKKK